MEYEAERRTAVNAVQTACRLCAAVRAALAPDDTQTKQDRSPVTVADFGSQAVVGHVLAEAFPDVPLMAEESRADLERANPSLRKKVVDHVLALLPGVGEREVIEALDRSPSAAAGSERYWVLDPLDGTKGFLRNGQYAVALALIIEGRAVVGVLGCPNLPDDPWHAHGPKGCIFVAVHGQGAYQRTLDYPAERRVHVSPTADAARAVYCESSEAGHSSHADSARAARLLAIAAPPLRMDSQAKYAVVARGEAAIYLRLPADPAYVEKVWDHAPGSLLVREAGGEVTDARGEPLDFSHGRLLRRNIGVVATNGPLHHRVLAAVRTALGW